MGHQNFLSKTYIFLHVQAVQMAAHYSLRSTRRPSFCVHKASLTSLSNYSSGVKERKYEQNNANCQSIGKLSICNIMHSIDVKLCSLHHYCVLPGPFQFSYAVQGREEGRQNVILFVNIILITLTYGLLVPVPVMVCQAEKETAVLHHCNLLSRTSRVMKMI